MDPDTHELEPDNLKVLPDRLVMDPAPGDLRTNSRGFTHPLREPKGRS
jgi:hypothetical protein